MSKLLKHLGFGGKKTHKPNVDNKPNPINNDNQVRNNIIKTNVSMQEPNISRNQEVNDVLKQSRRLPAHRNEKIGHKNKNNTNSNTRANKDEILQYINQTSDSKKHKNQNLREQSVPPLAEYSDPYDIKGQGKGQLQTTSDNSRMAKREDDYSYTLPYENKHKSKTPTISSIVVESEYERPWDKSSAPSHTSLQMNQRQEEEVQCPNYEEPWDLSTTQRRIASNIISTSSPTNPAVCIEKEMRRECVKVVSDQRVQRSSTGDTYEAPWDYSAEQLDTRCPPQSADASAINHPTDSYDTPWDWKPERTDNRPTDDSYESPWGDGKNIQKKPGGSNKQSRKTTTAAHSSSSPHAVVGGAGSAGGVGGGVNAPRVKPTSATAAAAPATHLAMKCDNRDTSTGYDEPWDKQNETTNIKLYKIDESLPLKRQSWYHGAIGRLKAEQILLTSVEASFLVRQSESNKDDFSLSLKSTQGYMHMKIVRVNNQFILGQFSQPFCSVPAMISHYTIHKLPIKGAEHMSLVYAIAAETL